LVGLIKEKLLGSQEGYALVRIVVVVVGTAICLQAAVFALAAGHVWPDDEGRCLLASRVICGGS